MKKVVYIFGAGISGCTMSRLYAENGYDVFLFESKDNIGGNCFDYQNKDGIYVHKYGPHIFHTSYEDVWEFVNRFSEFNGYKNKVKVNLQGSKKLISFPINFTSINELYDEKSAEIIIQKLKWFFHNEQSINIYELLSVQDAVLKKFANYIFENIYKNYTIKMWGISVSELDENVLKRVKINLDFNDNYFINDKYQGIPSNGYTNLFKNIIDHENIHLNLLFDFKKNVVFKDKKIFLNNKDISDNIIYYCGSIDELFDYKYGKLPYRSLDIQFEDHNLDFYQEVGVVNYPWHKSMTRITEYKYLSKQEHLRNTTISKEFPGQWDENSERFKTRFYPINNSKNLEIYDKYNSLLSAYNIIPLGRLANYKYFDMDDSIKNVFEIFEQNKN